MNLVLCQSRLFLVYLLAYIDQFGNSEQFEICLLNPTTLPESFKSKAADLNCIFVDQSEIFKRDYEELIVHSYDLFGHRHRLLNTIKHKYLTLYSDGTRNGFYPLFNDQQKLSKLIYFGFRLREDFFESNILTTVQNLQVRVVSFFSLDSMWNSLCESNSLARTDVFTNRDLLLVMRYWADSNSYPFAKDKSILEYLKSEFPALPEVDRIVFRAHPWGNQSYSVRDLRAITPTNMEIVMWEDLFQQDTDVSECCEPEAVLTRTLSSPGFFFGFDSSLNTLVSRLHPSTSIMWPKLERYSEFFALANSANLVTEQLNWMKEFESCMKLGSPPKELFVDGSAMGARISRAYLSSMENIDLQNINLRDALTQERDALTQERDALTQERDALTQERDALINSTIWGLTEPLRKILNILKKLK
jgi:hypothetical protein